MASAGGAGSRGGQSLGQCRVPAPHRRRRCCRGVVVVAVVAVIVVIVAVVLNVAVVVNVVFCLSGQKTFVVKSRNINIDVDLAKD